MSREFARSFYKSKQWQQCREGFIKSVYGLCKRCGQPGYIVHHKKELTPKNINDPSITLGWDNLEYLCQECHNKEHFGNGITREGLHFDAEGNLIESKLITHRK